jgi:uncharacterized damage-inducible protein DinB
LFTIQELYNYSSRVRHRFADQFAKLTWEEVEKNREASFYSMKNILIHMIDNEDWMVNWVIHGKSEQYTRRKSAEYTSRRMLLDHLDEVEKKTKSYIQGADESELKRRVKLTLSSGQVFDMSVEECLFQSFTEQLYHLGELIALMWQHDIEPPRMQWFWNNPRGQPTE